MHARDSSSPPAFNRPLFRIQERSVDAKKESKFFYPECRTMSLKCRWIIVDESALAPIAGRKLTFDNLVSIVMRCKTFACIQGAVVLKFHSRIATGIHPVGSFFSISLSFSLSSTTSAAFFRGPGLTWHTATTTGVTQRPAISFIEERRIRDESRAYKTLSRRGWSGNQNVF